MLPFHVSSHVLNITKKAIIYALNNPILWQKLFFLTILSQAEKLWFISLWLPISTVVIIGTIFPLILSTLPNNNPLLNAQAGACTILVAIGISELVTQTFKFYVGRLRPNFYAMCGFDKETLECKNGEEMEMEARMSFPSGHSSLSFCGLVCVVLFFLGRVGLERNKSVVASGRGKILTVLSFTPLLLSFWCATSRLVGKCWRLWYISPVTHVKIT